MEAGYVIDEEGNLVKITGSIDTIEIKNGTKVPASRSILEHLFRIANFLSKHENKKPFISFKKYGYIIELFEKNNEETAESEDDAPELSETEIEIVNLFKDMELYEIISLLNTLEDIKYPILKRFLLNLLVYIMMAIPAEELTEYFKNCGKEPEEDVPDYII